MLSVFVICQITVDISSVGGQRVLEVLAHRGQDSIAIFCHDEIVRIWDLPLFFTCLLGFEAIDRRVVP